MDNSGLDILRMGARQDHAELERNARPVKPETFSHFDGVGLIIFEIASEAGGFDNALERQAERNHELRRQADFRIHNDTNAVAPITQRRADHGTQKLAV